MLCVWFLLFVCWEIKEYILNLYFITLNLFSYGPRVWLKQRNNFLAEIKESRNLNQSLEVQCALHVNQRHAHFAPFHIWTAPSVTSLGGVDINTTCSKFTCGSTTTASRLCNFSRLFGTLRRPTRILIAATEPAAFALGGVSKNIWENRRNRIIIKGKLHKHFEVRECCLHFFEWILWKKGWIIFIY